MVGAYPSYSQLRHLDNGQSFPVNKTVNAKRNGNYILSLSFTKDNLESTIPRHAAWRSSSLFLPHCTPWIISQKVSFLCSLKWMNVVKDVPNTKTNTTTTSNTVSTDLIGQSDTKGVSCVTLYCISFIKQQSANLEKVLCQDTTVLLHNISYVH